MVFPGPGSGLDQKLPACLNAKEGDEDLDTGTGEEGDVEARCFRACVRITAIDPPCSPILIFFRARLAKIPCPSGAFPRPGRGFTGRCCIKGISRSRCASDLVKRGRQRNLLSECFRSPTVE